MQTSSASTSSNIAPVQLIATIGIGKPTDQAEAQLQFTEQDDDPFKVYTGSILSRNQIFLDEMGC